MNLLIFAGLMLGLAVLLSVLALSRRQSIVEPPDATFELDFSEDRYRPMERLLREEDYVFLSAQPGFEPAMARKLRRARHRVYFSYLRLLSRDFYRLHAAAVQLVLTSDTDRPDLAALLARQKITFQIALFRTYVALGLSACGVGTVNPAPALEALRQLNSVGHSLTTGASA